MAIRSWIRIPGFHFPHHCRIWHFIGSSFFNILIQSLMLMFTKRGEVTDTDKGTQFWKGSSQWTGHPDPNQSGFASGITFSWGWSFSGMIGVGGGMLFASASCFLCRATPEAKLCNEAEVANFNDCLQTCKGSQKLLGAPLPESPYTRFSVSR